MERLIAVANRILRAAVNRLAAVVVRAPERTPLTVVDRLVGAAVVLLELAAVERPAWVAVVRLVAAVERFGAAVVRCVPAAVDRDGLQRAPGSGAWA